jgi:RHS repeat-associated protein
MLVVEHSSSIADSGNLQDKTYAYDPNGNITNIKDTGHNNAASYFAYSYDDVNRLTLASTTFASTTSFAQSYTYNSIGNLTNKSDAGNYTYAGTGNANPHAPTTINGVTYTYDNSGNLTSAGSQRYSWDYRNRVISAGNGTATSTYGYDYLNQRVRKAFQNATTTYPNKYMSKSAATTTDYIYMGDTIIAEVETASSTASGGSGFSTSTIAFNATSTSITTTTSGTTTKTWTHTVNGTNPVIVLTADIAQNAAGVGSIGSVSWNGAAFTKATSTRKNNMEAEVWYLVASTTGAKTMSVTVNGTTTAIRLGAASFTGVSTSSPFEFASSTYGSGGYPSISVTPANSTDVVVSTLSKSGGGSGGGGSTPAYVQSNKAVQATQVSLTNTVSSGNLIIVGITTFGQTVPSNAIHDNKGNTYTKAVEAINTGTTDHAAIFYAMNVNGGASFTASSSVDGTLTIHEYSGVATSNALDKTNTGTGSSSNAPKTASVTTSTSSELYFGLAWSGGDGDAWTAGSGYFLRQNETDNNVNERHATEDAVIASASSTYARWTTTNPDAYAAAIATFNPSSAGGGSTSADATSSQTTLWKDIGTSSFGGASYKIATTSGAITDTYTTATSTDWVMVAIGLRPATSTSSGSSGGLATTTRYFLPDHLNSTNVVTDASGTPIQVLDYHPYGSTRVNQQFNTTFNEGKQYIGQYADLETSLSYLNARYYDNSKGEFLSEDPVFWGDPKRQVLTDPQSLNSFSYANDNPITYSDPNGKQAASLAASYGTGYLIGGETGPLDILVGTVIGTGIFLAANSGQRSQPTSPGFGPLRESMVQNAYGSDPQFGGPIGKPPGNWGPLTTTIITTGVASYLGCSLFHCDLDFGTQASAQPAVSGTSRLSTPGSIPWNNISYPKTSAPTQTNYSSVSSRSSAQSGGGSSAYISVLQQTVSVLQSIVRSYGATPVR